MKNALVAYFSAEAGTTRRIAEGLADAVAADLYEIKPEKPYSEADLRWTNPLARCNREKLGKKDVPVEGKVPGWAEYDERFAAFLERLIAHIRTDERFSEGEQHA